MSERLSVSLFNILVVGSWFLFANNALADTLPCFGSIDETTTVEILTKRCGPPARDVGSGLYVLVWDLPDASQLSVSSAGKNGPLFSARFLKPGGNIDVLYEKKADRLNKSRDTQGSQPE